MCLLVLKINAKMHTEMRHKLEVYCQEYIDKDWARRVIGGMREAKERNRDKREYI
jgi:hypothetical protein